MADGQRPARTRTIRVTLVGLLLVPLLALVGLWAFAASITLGNVIRYQHYTTLAHRTSASTGALTGDLAAERSLTLAWVGSGRRIPQTSMLAARHATDTAAAASRTALASTRGLYDPVALSGLNSFLADLASLPRIRGAADSGATSVVTTYRAYDKISTALWEFLHISAPPSDATLSTMSQSAVAVVGLGDSSFGAVSLIEAALAAGGQMTQPERTLFAQVVGQQNLLLEDTFTLSTPSVRAVYARAFESKVYRRLLATENKVENSPVNRPIPVNPQAFQGIAEGMAAAVQAPLSQIGTILSAQSANLGASLVTQLVLAGGLGLLAVGASVFLMARFGRSIRRELTGLRDGAGVMANEHLPHVIERLRGGDEVDVEAASPPLPTGRITEIASVAQAFSTVQRTAVEAAVGQANLRKGVNQVFLNLSLRNQSLLHRQLGMLDTMERATNEPNALADLFRLDHLTTRMRRHAEGLIILSGATPGRGWRDPVPVLDVLRAAIAEVEDYVRVDVASESRDAVVGGAVNDVIHLVAELVENATTFSPPTTRVEIRADVVGNGLAVEIEDRGLGLAPGELADINARLASPPEFDLANSDQLGLFVVGQLAARHGIRVSLRESPYGGTTAIVLMPHSVIVREGETRWRGPASGTGQPALAGRPAAPLPADATGPIPVPDDGTGLIAHRERASAFSLTGRHRQGPVPPQNGTMPGRDHGLPPAAHDGLWAGLSEPAGAASPARGPWDPAQPGPAEPAAPPPRPDLARRQPSPAAGTHRGLPRRVRQASIAPQLRDHGAAEPAASRLAGPPIDARSPDETRNLFSSLQQGWQRGRVDDLDYPDDDPGEWPGGRPGGSPDSGNGEAL
jgi:signal transduction histidine kinase